MTAQRRPLPIRDAEPGDLDILAQLEAATFRSSWSRSALARQLAADHGVTLVGTADDRRSVCAYASFQIVLDQAELLRIAVASAHRRAGWGKALLHAGWHRLRPCGVRIVHLEVRDNNTEAVSSYQAKGFQITGQRGKYYQDPAADALPDDTRDLIQTSCPARWTGVC